MSNYTVDGILQVLNQTQRRATYSAVGALVGVRAQSVAGYLGIRRPEASWVVSKGTGMPTDYLPEDLHPALQSNSHVIEEPDELIRLMEEL